MVFKVIANDMEENGMTNSATKKTINRDRVKAIVEVINGVMKLWQDGVWH